MFKYIRDSLLLRAGLAMGLVTFLAVIGMVSAIYIAHSTHGEAGTVNLAGSLRMQSYRITTALELNAGTKINSLIKEFEQRLHNPILSKAVEHSNRQSLQQAYVAIKDKWHSSIVKIIDNYTKDFIKSSVFHAQINDFVADIDHMVRLLEQDAESSIHLLGLIQIFILFLTLIIAIVTLYLLHTDVLHPLHELLDSAERASHGDFTVRVANVGTDELGRLGLAFNHMAGEISKMYDALEERVANKTKELTLRNSSLELLYTASQYLTKAPVSENSYHELLSKISQIMLCCQGISLCLINDNDKDTIYKLARVGSIPPMCNEEKCGMCLGDKLESNTFSIPVSDQEQNYGVLLIQRDNNIKLEDWQVQVLETLGRHIGLSIGVSRRIIQNRRLALLDERAVIARELHDSLAQSLSYLKIQVTRLFLLKDNNQVDEILTELKEGLDSAYRQLRELLTTFRIQMDGCGLASALSETVEEFNSRSKVEITLDNQIKNYPFSVNEEIHILQIVREALSNVLHHADANHAQVRIQQQDENIIVIIEDNGIGISQKVERTHHYGFTIMHERANSLNANLQIENRDKGGTMVILKFKQKVKRNG
ncbi:histidine kinase [Candidatus Marithrix sp. Canyon 246]|uniref:histidine kinase n=1 Tax=Candidatus Marithrix sp. Canyon 246 TaxID=1827136 RepID=UPI000849FC23|nr:histidine kinase [Candidatus Marithrix sp. Canyon 246]